MLSEEAIERMEERLSNRVHKLNTYMIQKLAEQIEYIGTLTPSQLRQVYQSIEYGNNLREIIQAIAEVTEKNEADIYKIFEEAAKNSDEYYRAFYKYRDMDFIPYVENKKLQAIVDAVAKTYMQEYQNIANTSAFMMIDKRGHKRFTKLSKIYQEVTEEAIVSVKEGRESYDEATRRIINSLTDRGIEQVDYASGYHRRVDSAVRMNVAQGIRQVNQEISEARGKEIGADGVEVIHHKNPAPDHSSNIKEGWHDVDGEQFTNAEFEAIQKDLNRPVGTLNCYHQVWHIILGVQEPLYTKEQLKKDKEENQKGFTYNGRHFTNYAGTQYQRRMESTIRNLKDRYIANAQLSSDEAKEECGKLKKKIAYKMIEYKKFCDISGFEPRMERLRIKK